MPDTLYVPLGNEWQLPGSLPAGGYVLCLINGVQCLVSLAQLLTNLPPATVAGNLTCLTLTCGEASFSSVVAPTISGVTSITGANPASATSQGANLTITAGAPGTTSGSGGALILLGASATNGLGGDAILGGGNGGGSGTGNTRRGGDATVQGGTGGPSANGGLGQVVGGFSGTSGGNGGDGRVVGGASLSPAGRGGQGKLFGGDGNGGGDGGDVTVAGGDTISGQPGTTRIDTGATALNTAGTATVIFGGQRTGGTPIVIDPMSWLRHGHTAGTVEGDVWEDSATHQIKFHNGTAVKTVTSS